jgi:branched-chain amino acid transport system permease protein
VRLVLNNLPDLTGGSIGLRNVGGIKIWDGLKITGRINMYYAILIFFFIFLWIAWKVTKSPLGMAFLSIKDNELAAGTLGIDVSKQKLKAFTFCCIYTSIAGSLYAATLGFLIPYDFNYDMSVRYVMMLVIGGIGTVEGSILGAILITVLPEALRFLQNIYWILFGAVTVIMVVLHPKGLVAIPETINNYLRDRKNTAKDNKEKDK